MANVPPIKSWIKLSYAANTTPNNTICYYTASIGHAFVLTPSSRAGESRSEARGNISFEGPIGPENTSGGGGVPLEIGLPGPYYTLGPGVSNPAYPPPPPSHRPCRQVTRHRQASKILFQNKNFTRFSKS